MGEPLNAGELAAFIAAVESGSVGGTAEALERRLGVAVLERGRFGVRATDAGRLLYPEAQAALSALRHAAAVVGTRSRHAPSLHLAASRTIGGFLLPAWIAGFRAVEHSPPRIEVEIVNSQAVLATVRDARAEIGFIESLHATDGLESLPLRTDEIVAVVAADGPWARRRSIATRMLTTEPYLTREFGAETRAVASNALARIGIELEPTLETDCVMVGKSASLSSTL
jgi:DNA-binding transcriptional LysR family regulator